MIWKTVSPKISGKILCSQTYKWQQTAPICWPASWSILIKHVGAVWYGWKYWSKNNLPNTLHKPYKNICPKCWQVSQTDTTCRYCVSSSKYFPTSQHDDHVKNRHVKLYKELPPRSSYFYLTKSSWSRM